MTRTEKHEQTYCLRDGRMIETRRDICINGPAWAVGLHIWKVARLTIARGLGMRLEENRR